MPSREYRPRLGRISLRFRLTIWVIAVVVLVQGALTAVAFLYHRQAVQHDLDKALQMRAVIHARDLTTPVEPTHLQQRASDELAARRFSSFAMAVFDAAGRPIAQTEHAPPAAASLARRAAEPANDSEPGKSAEPLFDWWASGGDRVRVVALPLASADDQTLLAWTDASAMNTQLSAIAQALLLVSPFAAAGATVAGWFIAGVAVGPIEEVRDIARRLTPESVGRRVRLGSAAAEVAQLQSNLNDALERLDAGYEAQARFISNVSHELKTPISTLLAEAQVLARRGDIDPEGIRFVRSVEAEMRRLGRLVESFLLLTQVRKGAPPPMNRTLVNELVTDSVAHCRPVADQAGVQLRPMLLEDDDGLELSVTGESDLLRSMLENLIRNAIRFSPPGAAIDIQAARDGKPADGGAGWVAIAVRDRGPGIAPGMLSRLFDRFAQAPEERSNGRGNGLGLEIAKGVAELHGGDITAENCPDAGARFTVRLPTAESCDGGNPAGQGAQLHGRRAKRLARRE